MIFMTWCLVRLAHGRSDGGILHTSRLVVVQRCGLGSLAAISHICMFLLISSVFT